jgi:hypothetical protein
MFSEGMEVKYKNLFGVIDFIDDEYLVIRLPAAPKRSSARVVVFNSMKKHIEVLKDSER